jgi:hypothetical protein
MSCCCCSPPPSEIRTQHHFSYFLSLLFFLSGRRFVPFTPRSKKHWQSTLKVSDSLHSTVMLLPLQISPERFKSLTTKTSNYFL